MYLLWSSRNNGWLTSSSTYSTDRSLAGEFNRDAALRMCKRHKNQAGYQLLPVHLEDLEAI